MAPVPLRNWVILALCCLAFCLTGGVMFGFNALKPALEKLHLFEDKCTAANQTAPCDDQIAALDHIIEFAGPAINLLSWPNGILVDFIGPRRTVIVGAVGLMAFGSATAFCLTPEHADILQYMFAGFGECGCLLFFGFMIGILQLNNGETFMGIVNTNSLLTVLWDLSTLVFVVLNKLTAYIELKWSFLGLFLIGGTLSFFIGMIAMPEKKSAATINLAPRRFYILPTLVFETLFAMSWLLAETFYMGSLGPQSTWIADGDKDEGDAMVDVFNFILPCLAPATLLVTSLLHARTKDRMHYRVFAAGGIGLLCMGLACVRIRPLQYANYVFFVFWRIYTSAQIYDCVAESPFAQYFGQFVGVSLTVSGAFALLAIELENDLHSKYNDNPRIIYIFQAPFMFICMLLAAYGFSNKGMRWSSKILNGGDDELQPLLRSANTDSSEYSK